MTKADLVLVFAMAWFGLQLWLLFAAAVDSEKDED